MSLLSIKELHGGYSEVDILNGVEISLSEGEILTVAGTNGAGKSTLAKAIVGLLPRISGSIVFDGREISTLKTEDRIASGIGYVPQVANIFPSLTILENLKVVAGVVRQAARIEDLFESFPLLKERSSTRAGSLSGGERQQLAVARALMLSPKMIILDEPTAALSPARVASSFSLIQRLPSLGVSVFMVEQRARQALAISHRGCILDGGKVVLSGEAQLLLDNPKAAELYLGNAVSEH